MKKLQTKGNGRIGLLVLLLAGGLALMWSLRQCSSAPAKIDSKSAKSGGDTIDVAIEYSPMSLYIYADTLGGLNYDALRIIASHLNLTVKIHPLSSVEQALEGLDNGMFDIVVADIPATLGHGEDYRFSEPVYLDRQVLVQRIDSMGTAEITTPLDLANRHVWVASGSPAIERLRNLSEEIGDTIFIEQEAQYGSEQIFLLVASGQIPLAVVNEGIALSLAKKYSTVDVSQSVSFTQFQSWAMRKDNDSLAVAIDSAIAGFKNSTEYRNLLNRYKK